VIEIPKGGYRPVITVSTQRMKDPEPQTQHNVFAMADHPIGPSPNAIYAVRWTLILISAAFTMIAAVLMCNFLCDT
jgi:hypothetical protein